MTTRTKQELEAISRFGSAIRSCRTRLGWSVADLGKLITADPSSVAGWERGNGSRPSDIFVERLYAAMPKLETTFKKASLPPSKYAGRPVKAVEKAKKLAKPVKRTYTRRKPVPDANFKALQKVVTTSDEVLESVFTQAIKALGLALPTKVVDLVRIAHEKGLRLQVI